MAAWYVWLLWLALGSAHGSTDCSEYIVNQCTGDPEADYALNAGSQDLCQAHCELFGWCLFYAYHSGSGVGGVDCHLYDEEFSEYINHCQIRGGPKQEAADLAGPCFAPEPDSCQVGQFGDCTLGRADEILEGVPTEFGCEAAAAISEHAAYWTYKYETSQCSLYDSADMTVCKVAFGPHSGTPADCGVTTDSPTDPTTTPPTGPTVTPPTPPPCDVHCPVHGLALFPDCDHCDRFYECFEGQLTSKTCPYCNLFDADTKMCNQPHTVNCGERPAPNPDECEPCKDPPPCLCPIGWFPDPLDCDAYFHCLDSAPTPYTCHNGTFDGLYNSELIQCDFEDRVDCGTRPVCRGQGHSQCQCQGAPVAAPPDCGDTQGIFLLEDPYNCQHYFICIGGVQNSEVSCPAGSYLPSGGQDCSGTDSSVCGGRPVCTDIGGGTNCSCP